MTGQFGKNHLGDRNERIRASAPGASRAVRTPARLRETHGEGGRGVSQGYARFYRSRRSGNEAVLRVVQSEPHAYLDPANGQRRRDIHLADGGTKPFRSEKNTNWEGGYRVPALVRWPGLVNPDSEINDIVSADDWIQTLMAAADEPDIQNKPLQGYSAGGKTLKVSWVIVHPKGGGMKRIVPRSGVNRRVLLSALAALPSLSGTLLSVSASAQTGTAGGIAAILE